MPVRQNYALFTCHESGAQLASGPRKASWRLRWTRKWPSRKRLSRSVRQDQVAPCQGQGRGESGV